MDFSEFQPNISLIVSGGHTMLVQVETELTHRLLGSTVDDAAGECFDKIGKLIGLPYPAGDRKSTRLNSSHGYISHARFCLKKTGRAWSWPRPARLPAGRAPRTARPPGRASPAAACR